MQKEFAKQYKAMVKNSQETLIQGVLKNGGRSRPLKHEPDMFYVSAYIKLIEKDLF